MTNLATILLCMTAGYLLRRSGKFTEKSSSALNVFALNVAFPPLIIHHIPASLKHTGFSMELLVPISMAWILVLVALIVFNVLGRIFKWKKETIGALVLTAGFGSTSFVGFPIIEALLGSKAMDTAIIVSQAGTFLALSTIGLVIATVYSKHDTTLPAILKRLATFPPFLALVFSILIYLMGITIPAKIDAVLVKLAASLTPVILVSVGSKLHFKFDLVKPHQGPLLTGLFFKLIFSPILFWLLYGQILHDYSKAAEITLLESAMAPVVTGAIIAAQFELDAKLAYLLVGIGVPLSLISVPFWFLVAKTVFGS
ncbi:MAG: AEC family transporter [bacterium]|nr:AEC family transporter [bacterium]